MSAPLQRLKEVIPRVREHVERRISEFHELGERSETLFNFRPFLDLEFRADLFSELCFCLLTANSSATLGLRIQASAGEGFMTMDYSELTALIARHGHRFPEQRAERILMARERWEKIREALLTEKDSGRLRDLLSDPRSDLKIKGFGYKEASHFLRNVGRSDIAIVDRHVYRFLVESGLYPEVKTITPRRYREMERALGDLCSRLGVTQAELDLYIFYLKTGKVLK